MTWQGSPFPGLRHFTADDAPIFFGRTQETTALLTRVGQERFVAVVGASGSGKSSLVAAGLLPRLHELPNGQQWQWVRLTPGALGDDPFVALAAALAPTLERYGLTGRDIASRLRASGDLAALTELCLAGRPATAALLLFIDQFEELFILTAPEHHRRFIAMLARAVQSPAAARCPDSTRRFLPPLCRLSLAWQSYCELARFHWQRPICQPCWK